MSLVISIITLVGPVFKVSSIFGVRERSIDYVLARRSTLRALGRGSIQRHEVCDAQPELMRAALNVGLPKPDSCPVCSEESLVSVLYAFGAKLPSHGRCLTSAAELEKLAARSDFPTIVYQVEVCVKCRWNHLDRVVTKIEEEDGEQIRHSTGQRTI